jgi:acetyl-CoA carboxylase biotin carboxyl carrier protein
MVSLEELKKYIDFLSTTDIEELEVETPEGEKFLLKRSEVLSNIFSKPQIETTKEDKVEEKKLEEKKEFVITSPMVGRFLLSPSKDHPPFIVENAKVKQGQKIAIIETMRIFRDVVSPKNGVVKKILVEDGQFVEYNQPLVFLELEEEQNK